MWTSARVLFFLRQDGQKRRLPFPPLKVCYFSPGPSPRLAPRGSGRLLFSDNNRRATPALSPPDGLECTRFSLLISSGRETPPVERVCRSKISLFIETPDEASCERWPPPSPLCPSLRKPPFLSGSLLRLCLYPDLFLSSSGGHICDLHPGGRFFLPPPPFHMRGTAYFPGRFLLLAMGQHLSFLSKAPFEMIFFPQRWASSLERR